MNLSEPLLESLIVVIAVVSLFSNFLVLLSFTHSAELRAQVSGIFILNLSFCNILTSVLNMPSTFLGLARDQKPFGEVFCWTVGFMDTFLPTNAMLSMAALSLDRWIAVVFPLTYSSKMRHRDAVLMVGYVWMHSLLFSLIPVLFSWFGYSPVYASCSLVLPSNVGQDKFMVFSVIFHATSFVLSLIILCFTYSKVLKVARFHCKRIDVITVQTLLLLVDIHPRLAELFPLVKINHHWGVISKCLVYSKAAMDPFVYSLLRQQYRKALIGMTNRILSRDPYSPTGHSTSSDTDNECSLPRVS